ncbi:hypothetical protein OROMI_033189 [Orobanche minor]
MAAADGSGRLRGATDKKKNSVWRSAMDSYSPMSSTKSISGRSQVEKCQNESRKLIELIRDSNRLTTILSSPTAIKVYSCSEVSRIDQGLPLLVLTHFRVKRQNPFVDTTAEDSSGGSKEYVHIRIQHINCRRSLTTIQGVKKDFSYQKFSRTLRSSSAAMAQLLTTLKPVMFALKFLYVVA